MSWPGAGTPSWSTMPSPFASRRVRVGDVSPVLRKDLKEVNPESEEEIKAYNQFAAEHENIMAKSLFCAGTTWPGVFTAEDQRALDYLCSRADVDADRVGCAGLSGGGLRTCLPRRPRRSHPLRLLRRHDDHLARLPPQQVPYAHLDDLHPRPAARTSIIPRSSACASRCRRWS